MQDMKLVDISGKKREYLKSKINELETNSKNKNIRELYRGINDFKKGYQPRTNILKDENGNLVADCRTGCSPSASLSLEDG
jgi:C4-type Zn-finger protein